MSTPETDYRRASGVELRTKPPRIYVRTFWFAWRVGLRIAGTLVTPIFVFWALVWITGNGSTADGPFSTLALRSWIIVSFTWALIDATRRPVLMNLITWLLVFFGVGAVMTVMGLAAEQSLASDAIVTAAGEALHLVGPGSLIPAAIGVGIGTVVRGVLHRPRRATPAHG